jgi:MtN3 and saliva related transmembrane protein
MDYLEYLGFAAGLFSMIAFIPQVYKTYKLKSAKGISIQTFIILSLGLILWIAYGLVVRKAPLYITNAVVLVVSSAQIILKIKYDKADKLLKKTRGM